MIEGQSADAWAAGFSAAALSALRDAPNLLVNGDRVPAETAAILRDVTTGGSTAVVCAASSAACDAVAESLQ